MGKFPLRTRRDVLLGLFAFAAALGPVLAIAMFPETVFWVADRFLLALHKEYIMEFQSIATIARISGGGVSWLFQYIWPVASLGCGVVLWSSGKLGPIGKRGLLLLAPAVLITQVLTVNQVRWASAAFAMWALVMLVLLWDLVATPDRGRIQRWVFRFLMVWCWVAIGLTLLPQVAIRAEEERTCLESPIPRDIAGNLLLRDVAHRLIQSSPDAVPVVLTGPNASTEMAYHSGVRTLGTLYWENMPGLKRAARIFSVPDEKTALAELTKVGITHIVVPSWDNFAENYARLLAKAEGIDVASAPFFKAILENDAFPQWLRPFAYPIPTNSGLDANSVKIFAFLPAQSQFESLYYRGVYFVETNQPDKARTMFREASAMRPDDPRPVRYLREMDAASATAN